MDVPEDAATAPPAPQRTGDPVPDPGLSWLWMAAMGIAGAFAAYRLGIFDLWARVPLPDGGSVRLPNTFASVDHPFHASRAVTLLHSLQDGHILRWVGNHQGGYPAEFYPLGAAWLEVGVWGILLGTLPMLAVHNLVVILVFLLPGLAYWLMARRDRITGAVPFAALVVHVAVPGGWVHGGWKELVVWGLVTNVTAAVALLFVLWALAAFLHGGSWATGGVAAGCAAFALATNPRSAVGLGIVGIGCWITAVAVRPSGWRPITARLAIVAAVAGSLAAPILIPLIRFSDLYYFVRYSGYESIGFYVDKILTSVSPPVALLAVAGVAIGLFVADRPVARAAAITLALYILVTAVLATDARDSGLLEQLEATRLMPFQRLLTIYLGAVGAESVLGWILPRRAALRDGVQAAAALALFVVYVRPVDPVPANDHGLMDVGEPAQPGSPALLTTGNGAQAQFLSAVRVADAVAADDGAMLILGSALGWHQQLWAPIETERPLYFNDFLWFWHTLHAGPYDYRQGNAYPGANVPETLDEPYLSEHGIAVVVVTSEPFKAAAAAAPTLELVAPGLYDVYRVRDPAPIVRLPGGETTSLSVTDREIAANGTTTGGAARIARNWYPRWRAEVNGDPAAVRRGSDGYMSVDLPPGDVAIRLTYRVDGWDWLGRAMGILGAAAGVGMVGIGPLQRTRRRAFDRA